MGIAPFLFVRIFLEVRSQNVDRTKNQEPRYESVETQDIASDQTNSHQGSSITAEA